MLKYPQQLRLLRTTPPLQSPLPWLPLRRGAGAAAPERSPPPQRPYGTSPPRSARHLPLTRGGIGSAAPPLAPLAKGSWRAAPERSSPPQRPYGTSPPRSARHLPLTRGGIGSAAPPLAPLAKGSWRAAPERSPRRSGKKRLPSQGSCRRRRLRGRPPIAPFPLNPGPPGRCT